MNDYRKNYQKSEKSKAYRKAWYEANKQRESENQKQRLAQRGVGVYGYRDKIEDVIVYIGSGYIWKRRKNHEVESHSNKNKALKSLFEQNGIERYEFVILEECEKDVLRIREQYYQDLYKPTCNINKAYRTEEDERTYRNKKWMERYYAKRKTT